MERVEISGVLLDVSITGHGRPLVYLPPEHDFAQQARFIEQLAEDWEVYVPQHPGFCGLPPPPSFRRVDDLAYLYLDLLEHFDLREVTLVGSSFGGWVALELGIRNAARLSALVLIGALGVKFTDTTARAFADLSALPDDEVNRLLYFDPGRFARDIARLDDQALLEVAYERQYLAHFGWRPYLHNPGLSDWLHRIHVPTLVMCGESDGYVPAPHAQILSERLPRASLETVPRAGHYPQVEQPEITVQHIRAFGSEIGGGA